MTLSTWNLVYAAVNRIPGGRVATYGQIAVLAGMPGAARQVGWALSALDAEDDVPWHRVINAKGEISSRGAREVGDLQRGLLGSEGVRFDARGRVDLGEYAWHPRAGRLNRKSTAARTAKTGKSMKAERSGKTRTADTKTDTKSRARQKARARKPGAKE